MKKDAIDEVIKREKAREQGIIDVKNAKKKTFLLKKQFIKDIRQWYAEYFEVRYDVKLGKFHKFLLALCPDICYRIMAAQKFVPIESHEIHEKYEIRRTLLKQRNGVKTYIVRHKLDPFGENKDVNFLISCVDK